MKNDTQDDKVKKLEEQAAAFLDWRTKMTDGKASMYCPFKQERLMTLTADFRIGTFECHACGKTGSTGELLARLVEIKRAKESGWMGPEAA